MTPGYRILFAVDIVHDYFNNGVCTHFRFVPSAETTVLMMNCNAMYKSAGNKLIVLIKADQNNIPVKPPAVSDRFVFFMELMQPVFINISAPDLGKGSAKRFYFTNLHQNKFSFSAGDDIRYLSSGLKVYDSSTAYPKSAMVIQNDITYECVENAANTEAPATTAAKWVKRLKNPSATTKFSPYENTGRKYKKDEIVFEDAIIYKCVVDTEEGQKPSVSPGFWKPFTNNQFAGSDDFLKVIAGQFVYTLPVKAKQVKIQVLGLNPSNNKLQTDFFNEVQNFEEAVTSVSIDLSKLKNGRYKLIVNNNEELIYISNMAAYNNYFGVIELFNHLEDDNSFSFYKTGGVLKDEKIGGKNVWLNYTIRFANRLAFVKYIVKKKGVAAIDTEPPTNVFDNTNGPPEFFRSKQRLPLQERTHGFMLKLKPGNQITTEPTFPAPNPDINAPGMMTNDENDYYCNIYLNY